MNNILTIEMDELANNINELKNKITENEKKIRKYEACNERKKENDIITAKISEIDSEILNLKNSELDEYTKYETNKRLHESINKKLDISEKQKLEIQLEISKEETTLNQYNMKFMNYEKLVKQYGDINAIENKFEELKKTDAKIKNKY